MKTNEWMTVKDFVALDPSQRWFMTQTNTSLEFKMPDGKTRTNPIWKHIDKKYYDSCMASSYNYKIPYPNAVNFSCRIDAKWHEEYCKDTEVYVRMRPKDFERVTKVQELLQPGDFVSFSGSKGRYKWRKMLEYTTAEKMVVFGQCASEPNDEKLALHSSTNSIGTVKEIYRDGKKIYPA